MTLDELFGERAKRFEPMRERLRTLMGAEGLPYRDPERIYNTRLAQELAAWAQAERRVDLHPALFRAYFAEGGNLGRLDELVEVARAADLPGELAREVLETRSFRAAVDR